MKLIIDRIEGKYAICENEEKQTVNVDRSKLPIDSKIGDIIYIDENNTIIIDKKATNKRKEYIEELTKDIWQ